MQRHDPYVMVVVPNHKTMKPDTFRKVFLDTDLKVDEVIALVD